MNLSDLKSAVAGKFGELTDIAPGVYSFKLYGVECRLFAIPPAGEVESVQFYVGFAGRFDIKAVNAWNQEYRFVKTYIPVQEGLAVEMDVAVVGDKASNADALDLAMDVWLVNFTKLFSHFGS